MYIKVRYLGLLENLKVRRAGFCYRTTFDRYSFHFCLLVLYSFFAYTIYFFRWVKRYGVISDRTFPNFQGDLRQAVEILLSEVGIASKDYAFGKTKLFVREPQAV
jgi:myosin I